MSPLEEDVYPEIIKFPLFSSVRPVPISIELPPIDFCQIIFPDGSNLESHISVEP